MAGGLGHWRVAILLPVGLALGLAGVIYALTAGGPAPKPERATATSESSARAPSSRPPPVVAAPSRSSIEPAPADAGATEQDADAEPSVAPPLTRKERLAKQRDDAAALLKGYDARLATMPAEISALERAGRSADAARKKIERQRLESLAEETRSSLRELDGELADAGR